MPSKPPNLLRWLTDISQNIQLAQVFTEGFTDETFQKNQLVFYAVTRCLEIISEASRRLPPELKEQHPSIPWAEMAAAGNFYRHEYGGIDQELVWGTLQKRLPELLVAIEAELKAFGDPTIEDC